MAVPFALLASLVASRLQSKPVAKLQAGEVQRPEQQSGLDLGSIASLGSSFMGSKGGAAVGAAAGAAKSAQPEQPQETAMTRRMTGLQGDNLSKLNSAIEAVPQATQDPNQRRQLAETLYLAKMSEEKRRRLGSSGGMYG